MLSTSVIPEKFPGLMPLELVTVHGYSSEKYEKVSSATENGNPLSFAITVPETAPPEHLRTERETSSDSKSFRKPIRNWI